MPIKEDDEDSKAGIVVKEIPGLCLSRVFDKSANVKGYVVFMHGDGNVTESNSTKNFQNHRFC
eukprot:1360509-Ditylum_brightwellii.AAC.1